MIAKFAVLLPLLAAVSAAPTKRAVGQQIHLNGDTTKCLSVEKLENGSPVANVACGNGWHNAWDLSNGNNANGVRIVGTDFCLDAGENPADGSHAKLWQCYPGAPQQTWWYTDDKHLAITGGNVCLDVGQAYVQTYQCIGYNTNQIWTLGATPPPVSSSASATASASASSSAPPTSSSAAPPTPTGVQIKAGTGCLTLGDGYTGITADGTALTIAECVKDGQRLAYQLFDLKRNSAGPIKLSSNPKFCVDAGTGGAMTNGNAVHLWTCYEGLAQQQWYYTDDNHLAIAGGNQCLDVKAGSKHTLSSKPFPTLEDVQTWQCSSDDAQQIFTANV